MLKKSCGCREDSGGDSIIYCAKHTPSVLTKSQKKHFGPVEYKEHGQTYRITARVRYDDECGNGRNSFSITADIEEKCGGDWYGVGGCRELIAKHFPKLAPLIKWHGCYSDGPSGYIDNTRYFAGDRDCWGYRAGETRAYRYDVAVNGGRVFNITTPKQAYALPDKGEAEAMAARIGGEIVAVPWLVSEGKPRELDAARRAAVWPDATDAELMQDTQALREVLLARLPKLMEEFRAAMESLGFTF